MGKWNPKVIGKKIEGLEQEKTERIKEILKSKPLISLIPDPLPSDESPTDGILLFGAQKGMKISELLSDIRTATYVTDFLCNNKILPKKFRRIISNLVDEFNPFDFSYPEEEVISLKISEIDPNDDLPW